MVSKAMGMGETVREECVLREKKAAPDRVNILISSREVGTERMGHSSGKS